MFRTIVSFLLLLLASSPLLSQAINTSYDLKYLTYFGGKGKGGDFNGIDQVQVVRTDNEGNIYVATLWNSLDPPRKFGALQSNPANPVFLVSKFDVTGTVVTDSVSLGDLRVQDMQVSPAGDVYLLADCTEAAVNDRCPRQSDETRADPSMIAKLDLGTGVLTRLFLQSNMRLQGLLLLADGSLAASGYEISSAITHDANFGTSEFDYSLAVLKLDPKNPDRAPIINHYQSGHTHNGAIFTGALASDAAGNIYLGGMGVQYSPKSTMGEDRFDVPNTADAVQPKRADMFLPFVLKFDAGLQRVLFGSYLSAYLGDTPKLAVAPNGDIFALTPFRGQSVLRISTANPGRAKLQTVRYFDTPCEFNVAFDAQRGRLLALVQRAQGCNGPNDSLQIWSFDADLQQLSSQTIENGFDEVMGLTLDRVGNLWIGGLTSKTLNIHRSAYQRSVVEGMDGLIARLTPSGQPVDTVVLTRPTRPARLQQSDAPQTAEASRSVRLNPRRF